LFYLSGPLFELLWGNCFNLVQGISPGESDVFKFIGQDVVHDLFNTHQSPVFNIPGLWIMATRAVVRTTGKINRSAEPFTTAVVPGMIL